ncbi:MAG: MFS transporter [Lachnospiraceae bacterium]|nr:MFS transporter [Lachnospiraceae bacterium]
MIHILLVIIYLAFISLGLPDSLLGSAWPVIHTEFDVPVSYAGAVSMIIAAGTIISSLLSDQLTRKLGTGRVTFISVGMTAAALFGFSVSGTYRMLLLWAIPYGLGAGSVDAALNNYVALHYASRHMSWLHCFWGVGASIGPVIMGAAITRGMGWHGGYRIIGILQIILTAMLVFSLPLWKDSGEEKKEDGAAPLSLRRIIGIPGAKSVMVCFFCYCALEQTTGLWASTFLVLRWNVSAEQAATLAGLFFIGITTGRAVSGFATFKFNDAQMVRIGQGIMLAGIIIMLLPISRTLAMAGFVAIGVGCAPVYPSLIHSTPEHFGADKSQAIIGVQMASAYLGTCLMPPLFGVLANTLSVGLMPFYLLALLALMIVTHEQLNRR